MIHTDNVFSYGFTQFEEGHISAPIEAPQNLKILLFCLLIVWEPLHVQPKQPFLKSDQLQDKIPTTFVSHQQIPSLR